MQTKQWKAGDRLGEEIQGNRKNYFYLFLFLLYPFMSTFNPSLNSPLPFLLPTCPSLNLENFSYEFYVYVCTQVWVCGVCRSTYCCLYVHLEPQSCHGVFIPLLFTLFIEIGSPEESEFTYSS